MGSQVRSLSNTITEVSLEVQSHLIGTTIAAFLAAIALLSQLTCPSLVAHFPNSAACVLYLDAGCPKVADTFLTLAPTRVLLPSIAPDWHTAQPSC